MQAAARVWRDGQRNKVFVYRFLATGTLEYKVFQRQLSKKGLQTVVVEEGDEVSIYVSINIVSIYTQLYSVYVSHMAAYILVYELLYYFACIYINILTTILLSIYIYISYILYIIISHITG